jgi:hypothetical protein
LGSEELGPPESFPGHGQYCRPLVPGCGMSLVERCHEEVDAGPPDFFIGFCDFSLGWAGDLAELAVF